jgi:hypothetical protein
MFLCRRDGIKWKCNGETLTIGMHYLKTVIQFRLCLALRVYTLNVVRRTLLPVGHVCALRGVDIEINRSSQAPNLTNICTLYEICISLRSTTCI